MPAGKQPTAPAPIRTSQNTSDELNTLATTSKADATSSRATSSFSSASGKSQAEKNFFGALAQKVRERSRSRSRSRTPQPPNHTSASPTSTRSQPTPTSPMSPRPTYSYRHASESSTVSSNSSHSAKRMSTQSSEQSDWEKFTYGRHSNDVCKPQSLVSHMDQCILTLSQWLFGGFSVKDTASRIIHHHRRSSTDRP